MIRHEQSELLDRLLRLTSSDVGHEDVISTLNDALNEAGMLSQQTRGVSNSLPSEGHRFLHLREQMSVQTVSENPDAAMAWLKEQQTALDTLAQEQPLLHALIKQAKDYYSQCEQNPAAYARVRSLMFVPGRGWYCVSDGPDAATGRSIAQSIEQAMLGLTGTSKITFCGGIHFKFKPKKPGIEYAVHALDALLFADTVTNPSLFIQLSLPNVQGIGPNVIQPVLATQTVYGKTADKLPESELRFQNFTQQLLLQLVTGPGDGKLDNFIVSDSTEGRSLLAIDNEMNFEPELVERVGHKGHLSYIQSFLFFLPQMQEQLDATIIARFNSLNIESIFLIWLRDLSARNAMVERLGRPELIIEFDEGALQRTYQRLKACQTFCRHVLMQQDAAKSAAQNTLTGINLFRHVMPELAAFYAGIARRSDEITKQDTASANPANNKPLTHLERCIQQLQKGKRGDTDCWTFESLGLPSPTVREKIYSEEALKVTEKLHEFINNGMPKDTALLRIQSLGLATPISRELPNQAMQSLQGWIDVSQQTEPERKVFLDELRSGQSQVQQLRLQGQTIDGTQLLALCRSSTLSYLELDNTAIRLEDLKHAMALPGCFDMELCLGDNPHLGEQAWQVILQSPLFPRFSLKLSQGQILLLKGQKSDTDIPSRQYLPLVAKAGLGTTGSTLKYIIAVENYLVALGYPLIALTHGLSCLANPASQLQGFLTEFMTTLRYVIRFLEQSHAQPSQYLQHYQQLDATWRPIFYQLLQQTVVDKARLASLEHLLGHCPGPNGERLCTPEEEQAFRQRLMVLISDEQPVPNHCITIEGPTPGKVYLDLRLVEQLIQAGWLVPLDQPNGGDFHFERKKQMTAAAKVTGKAAEEATNPTNTLPPNNAEGFQHGNHFVIPIEWRNSRFHLKVMPDFPGMEMAYSLLTHRVLGEGAPRVELWKWCYGTKTYPILLSETIPGENLTPELLATCPLEHFSYQQQLLMTFLCNPGDANPGNYMAQRITTADGQTQLRLISIDNDRLFAPPFEAGKLRTTSVLYCFDELQAPLHPDLRQTLLALDAYQVLSSWLTDLETINQRYLTIFSAEELKQAMQPGERDQPSYLLALLKRGCISDMFYKLKAIQYWLTIEPNIPMTDLLGKLHPSLANHYQQVRVQHQGPINRFEQAVKNDYRREEIAGVKRYTSTVHMTQYLKLQGREVTPTQTPTQYWQQDIIQAKKELDELSISRQAIELAKQQFIQGDIKGFIDLPQAYAQEEMLASLHWDKVCKRADGTIDSQRQQGLLMQLIHASFKSGFERLILQACSTLNQGQLEVLLKKLPQLRLLKLHQVPGIMDIQRWDKLKLIQNLEELHLINPVNLRQVTITSSTLKYLAIKQAPQLTSVTINAKTLTQLNLSHCPLCATFNIQAPLLKEADFSNNLLLTDKHLQKLALQAPQLKQLNLQDCDPNKITYIDIKSKLPMFAEKLLDEQDETQQEDFKIAAGVLTELVTDQIKELKLDKKGLSGWLCKCLCQALVDNTSVKSIFTEILFTEIDAEVLANALEYNQSIESIVIEGTSIGNSGAEALAHALERNVSVKKLELTLNSIGNTGALVLAQMLQRNRMLTDFTLVETSFSDKVGAAFADILCQNCTLQKLVLIGIGDKGVALLAQGLAQNVVLISLAFSIENFVGSGIGDKGSIVLAQALEINNTLKYLSLSINSIGDKGAIALADMLKTNTTLIVLDLQYNAFDLKGLTALAETTLNHPSVTVTVTATKAAIQLPITLRHERLKFNKLEIDVKITNRFFRLGVTQFGFRIALPVIKAVADKLSTDHAYNPQAFQINPFSFFAEQTDRDNALFYMRNETKRLRQQLKGILTRWEPQALLLALDAPMHQGVRAFGFKLIGETHAHPALFTAVAQQLKQIFTDTLRHFSPKELSTMVLNHLMEHTEYYQQLADDRTFSSVVHRLSVPGPENERILLCALAHVLNVSLVIITGRADPRVVKKEPAEGIVYLGHAEGPCYYSLVRDLEIVPEESMLPYLERAAPIEPLRRTTLSVGYNV